MGMEKRLKISIKRSKRSIAINCWFESNKRCIDFSKVII